jgi:hypothetical protein
MPVSVSPLEPFDWDSSEATVEIQQVTPLPPRRPPRRRRDDLRDALDLVLLVLRSRIILLRPDVPGRVRLARGLAAAVLVAALFALNAFEGSDEPASPAASATLTGNGAAARVGPLRLPKKTLIRPGDTGKPVRQLQLALAELGYAPGKADGIYGKATKQAISAFQLAHGLDGDGVVGQGTIRALNAALAEAS